MQIRTAVRAGLK